MRRNYLSLICLVGVSAQGLAAEVDCAKLDEVAKAYSHRPYLGKVVGKGRLQFYSAPDAKCPIQGKFIIQHDDVFIYGEYNEFSQIMYPKGAEEDSGVWVYSRRINIIFKPDESPKYIMNKY